MIETPASAAPPHLRFSARGIEAVHAAAIPTLRVRLAIETADERPIRGVALNVRVLIAAERRRYDPAESERLGELFGSIDQWPRSLGSVAWTQTALNVPPFARETLVDVPLPCSYDFDVAAAKYLAALADGEVPIELLFNGNLFYSAADGRLQTAMIPWDSETTLRMPMAVWREAVDTAFPDSGWLRVRRDTLRQLQAYRSRRRLTDWDQTLAALLSSSAE
jgi:hypothetical protein